MYAVIKTGGKQYKVAQDDVLVVEKLDADAGSEFVFDNVLMMKDGDDVKMGAPVVEGAQVVAEVVEQRKGAKVIIFKKRQRNTYKRKKGHRQFETVIKITDILAKGGKTPGAGKAAAKPAAKKEDAPKAEAPKAAAPAAAEGGDKADDLTKLTGIGKVAAGKLVEAGFTSFAQLAAISDDDFAKLDGDIFKGRVPQEQLVAEAKDLQG